MCVRGRAGVGLAAVNRDHVALQIVFATECSSTRLSSADEWLRAVGVMSLDVGFEIESPSKC